MSQYAVKQPGKLNWFNGTVYAVGITLGYLGWFYIPHFWQATQVSSIMAGAANTAAKEASNAKILKYILKESRYRGIGVNSTDFKITREMFGDDVTPKGQRGKIGKSITIEYHGKTKAEWPLIGEYTVLEFKRRRYLDLAPVTWTKKR